MLTKKKLWPELVPGKLYRNKHAIVLFPPSLQEKTLRRVFPENPLSLEEYNNDPVELEKACKSRKAFWSCIFENTVHIIASDTIFLVFKTFKEKQYEIYGFYKMYALVLADERPGWIVYYPGIKIEELKNEESLC
jgi:hypothetical protein